MHRPTAAKSPRPRGPETNQQKEHEKKSGKSQKRKTKTATRKGGSGDCERSKTRRGDRAVARSWIRAATRVGFRFWFRFLRCHWGLCFGGERQRRTDGVLFALAPRVAPSNQKASDGGGVCHWKWRTAEPKRRGITHWQVGSTPAHECERFRPWRTKWNTLSLQVSVFWSLASLPPISLVVVPKRARTLTPHGPPSNPL